MFDLKKCQPLALSALAVCLFVAAGCGKYSNDVQEEGSSPAEATAMGSLAPRHGGQIVELTGQYDAELVIMENGMGFVYLYDAEGNPVEYPGKEVQLVVTTPDGKTQALTMEGMGTGAGAHFMNPVSEEMSAEMRAQGSYTAEITVTTPEGEQTGRAEIHIGENP